MRWHLATRQRPHAYPKHRDGAPTSSSCCCTDNTTRTQHVCGTRTFTSAPAAAKHSGLAGRGGLSLGRQEGSSRCTQLTDRHNVVQRNNNNGRPLLHHTERHTRGRRTLAHPPSLSLSLARARAPVHKQSCGLWATHTHAHTPAHRTLTRGREQAGVLPELNVGCGYKTRWG